MRRSWCQIPIADKGWLLNAHRRSAAAAETLVWAAEMAGTDHKVSQFWTMAPDAFLKQPVFSRDFPPMKG